MEDSRKCRGLQNTQLLCSIQRGWYFWPKPRDDFPGWLWNGIVFFVTQSQKRWWSQKTEAITKKGFITKKRCQSQKSGKYLLDNCRPASLVLDNPEPAKKIVTNLQQQKWSPENFRISLILVILYTGFLFMKGLW